MNSKRYFLLIFALCILSLQFMTGCGRYMTQFSPPVIISRYPALNADGVGSGEPIWVKFSKSMITDGFTSDNITGKVKYAGDMTASPEFFTSPLPEMTWSDSNTRLTIRNMFFIADPGNKVHILSPQDAFEDENGQVITEDTTLWDYILSGLYITDRTPAIDETVSNEPMVVSFTFNNPLATIEPFTGADHTAGTPEPYPSVYYFTNENRTISFEVTSWEVWPAVVDVTYEAADIYGNVVRNGQLLKFNLAPSP